ncbi:TIGR04348 family glycosyltransferase [Ramlibacter sp. AW1]|uniref:TIGR04348 family glycosyltransferase n=1 Tax=Ramlibacter aurantiacus TaxID=2801330 RepID=A0A937D4V8_9BURK|nr:selenoneine biosynthesis selenosugar synthase SenB [Ramlibacter aurantiacus]MBL0422120.1 TIGR04348 family glycosyltransferase [Ramlibacter aurantiacus]
MPRPSLVIVSPALASANNGNWQTAQRWRHLLSTRFPVRIVQHWDAATGSGDDLMLALHARRSADSVRAWAQARSARGLVLVLTGTDLYQDIHSDPAAQASLKWAERLVVLQDQGLDALPEAGRAKARVIYQSTTARVPLDKTAARLRAVMVGHLRRVKSPETLFEAAQLLGADEGILIDHIGGADEPAYRAQAQATQAACPHYRWLGPLPHGRTRQTIQRAHLLVHTSAMEGGAHVIMEAVRSGTPVLASRVPGNVGMLGLGYGGYFEPGDSAGLAALLRRCRQSQLSAQDPSGALLGWLQRQCDERAPLFAPEAERAALLQLIEELHP